MLVAWHAQVVISSHNDMVKAVREVDRRQHSFSLGSIAPASLWELTPIVSRLFASKTIQSDLQETEAALIRGLDDGTYDLIVLLHQVEELKPDGTLCVSRLFGKSFLPSCLFRISLQGKKGCNLKTLQERRY